MKTSFHPVSWKDYHASSLSLSHAIRTANFPLDEIVAISRGGLTLGHILSDLLRIPIYTIAIQSYTDIRRQGELRITGKLQSSIKNKHILLVDDISDSGLTLHRAMEYLKSLRPKNIVTATLFIKPQTTMVPDYFVASTTDWVIFPYEVTETIRSIVKIASKEKYSDIKLQKLLLRLGFTKEQIQFVRTHYLNN